MVFEMADSFRTHRKITGTQAKSRSAVTTAVLVRMPYGNTKRTGVHEAAAGKFAAQGVLGSSRETVAAAKSAQSV